MDIPISYLPEIEIKKLEPFQFGVREVLDKERIFSNIELSTDYTTRSIIITARGLIWAEPLEEYNIKYPANWWESFKEHWFSSFLLKKYPVKYTNVKIKTKMLYPNYVSIPNQKHQLYVEVRKDT